MAQIASRLAETHAEIDPSRSPRPPRGPVHEPTPVASGAPAVAVCLKWTYSELDA